MVKAPIGAIAYTDDAYEGDDYRHSAHGQGCLQCAAVPPTQERSWTGRSRDDLKSIIAISTVWIPLERRTYDLLHPLLQI
ncbi:hypothetical protein BHM03_00044139 [Ensete ventricosum]|nr:hypothetical protein BHM03_00044139 [Ensete ventricosum]